jgi:hypothetical protein
MSDTIIWDYTEHAGPWCVSHRSSQCDHALVEITERRDAPYIRHHITEEFQQGKIQLFVPMWPQFYIWEDLKFQIVRDPMIGLYGKLVDRGKNATYDLGVNRLIPGESAFDLSETMVRMFSDLIELEKPSVIPGCKSGNHKMQYQKIIDKYVARLDNNYDVPELMPHLYGLLGRETPMCAFCWADAYGGDARRVSANPQEAAKADDMSDLLFGG